MNTLRQGLYIHVEHWAQMEADVSSRADEEACGFVAGEGQYSRLVIPVTNSLHSPTRFRMQPDEELKALLLMEDRGLELLAVYHSHPHGISEPSITDHAELTLPCTVYLIWYEAECVWHCRGFIMSSQSSADEIPLIVHGN